MSDESFLTLAETVTKVLRDCSGDCALWDAQLLKAYVSDWMDPGSMEARALRHTCDEQLLAPFTEVIAGQGDLASASGRSRRHLTDECMVDAAVAEKVSRGIAEGVRVWLGSTSSQDSVCTAYNLVHVETGTSGSSIRPYRALVGTARMCGNIDNVNYNLDTRAQHAGCAAVLYLRNDRQDMVLVEAEVTRPHRKNLTEACTKIWRGTAAIIVFKLPVTDIESITVKATSGFSPARRFAWRQGSTSTIVQVSNVTRARAKIKNVVVVDERSRYVLLHKRVQDSFAPGDGPSLELGDAAYGSLSVYVNGVRIPAVTNAGSSAASEGSPAPSRSAIPSKAGAGNTNGITGAVGKLAKAVLVIGVIVAVIMGMGMALQVLPPSLVVGIAILVAVAFIRSS